MAKDLVEPHTHTTSLEQHNKQVFLIVENLEMLAKELKQYQDLQNTTMTRGIQSNINTRKDQLKQKMREVPPKDRELDIYNNKWCRECLPSTK